MKLQNLLSGTSLASLNDAYRDAVFEDALRRDALEQGIERRARLGEVCPDRTRETTRSIFAECKQARPQKKHRMHLQKSTGSIVVGVRVGTYTTCVCKHKVSF